MKTAPIKILSLGLGQSNFLNQLYGHLKKKEPQFSFSIDRYRDLSKGNVAGTKTVFDTFYDFSKEEFTTSSLLLTFIKILFKSVFWKYVFFEMTSGKSIRNQIKAAKNQAIYKHIVDKVIVPKGFDVYHFHFCIPYNLRYVAYLPKRAKVICSFWGSDLYRNSGKENVFYVKDALSRATVVTIQTPEMGEDLFKKYGMGCKHKLKFAQFAIEEKIYDLIDTYREKTESLDQFKEAWNIPEQHTVITIGYNANEAFNHIGVLECIQQFPKEVRDTISCILPLTYSKDGGYLNKLTQFLEHYDGCKVVRVDEFISHEDLAKLRLITDVQIQIPFSDALSGSVTEVLYAGNVVIAGSWLPYGIFDRYRIHYKKTSDLLALKGVLERSLQQLTSQKEENIGNREKVRQYFFPDYTSKAWLKIYQDLI